MLHLNVNQDMKIVEVLNQPSVFPIAVEIQPDRSIEKLEAGLSPEIPWPSRKTAAQKLGDLQSPEAVSVLENSLRSDPFWMVRVTIIQALERIGDPGVIPTLQEVVLKDGFQVVRSYAANAIKVLSRKW